MYEEEPSIGMILDMYFPTDFMEEVTKNSKNYVEKRRVLEPNLQIWGQKYMSAPFDIQSFYHLSALIFYMGVVHFTYKTEYWKDDNT